MFLASLLAGGAPPGRAEIRLEVGLEPTTVEAGEQAVLSVSVDGSTRVSEPVIPAVRGLRMQGGGRSTNISMVNGRVSQSTVFQFVVQALDPGTYTIGPIEVREGKTIHQGGPVTLTVTPARDRGDPGAGQAGRGGSARPGRSGPGGPAPSNGAGDDDLQEGERSGIFVRASIDKERAVVGEQVTLRFQFFQAAGFPVLDQPQYTAPPTEGFWKEELPPQRSYTRTLRGQLYNVTELVYALFPTQPGRLTIGPGEIQCTVRDRRRSADPFSFFGGFFGERTVRLRSRAMAVQVDPLPQPQPSDFTGGVGSYRLSASLDPAQAQQGSPVTLAVRVEGSGNVSAIGDPPLPDLGGIRSYPSGSEVKTNPQGDQLRGSKVFQVVLIPEATGSRRLPPVTLSVFDPAQRRYVRLETAPLTFQVLPAAAGSAGDGSGEVAQIGRDLRTIRLATDLERHASVSLHRRPQFWLLQALPLAFLAAAWWWRQRRQRLEANWGLMARKGAPARLRREIAALRAENADAAAGFDRLGRAIEAYLTDRLHLPVQGRTREDLRARLEEEGITESAMAATVRLLDRCDFARFAPQAVSAGDLAQACAEAESLPGLLERAARDGAARTAAAPTALLLAAVLAGAGGWANLAQAQTVPRTRSQAQAAFAAGNDAYAAGDFLRALRSYGAVVAGGYESPDLFLNLGNAAFRLGRIGWAVYYFERGLRLAPADPDLRTNLDLARQRSAARAGEIESSGLLHSLVGLQQRTSTTEAFTVLAVIWWVFVAWIAGRLALGALPRERGMAALLRDGRVAGAVNLTLGALLVLSAGWAAMKAVQEAAGGGGIVVAASTAVRSNPDPEATVEFTLEAGTRVRLGRSAGGFHEVLYSDKLRGWASREDLARLDARGADALAPADREALGAL